jgi:hypothetical protein
VFVVLRRGAEAMGWNDTVTGWDLLDGGLREVIESGGSFCKKWRDRFVVMCNKNSSCIKRDREREREEREI